MPSKAYGRVMSDDGREVSRVMVRACYAPAGDRMLGWARRLRDQAEQARREVAGERPRLRLGALETIAATHVPGVLARLAERRPGVEVEVSSDGSRDTLLAGVVAGELAA